MRRQYLGFIGFVSLLSLIACQPQLTKQTDLESRVDSTLYFQPVTVNDSFIDSLQRYSGQRILLQKTVFPPPLPVTEIAKYKEVEGYRVQVFAGVDSLNALAALYRAKQLVADSSYIFKEKGLIKVQVGDYLYYPQADAVKSEFLNNGFSGAWIVKRPILIAKSGEEIEQTGQAQSADQQGTYRIQVLATAREDNAVNVVAELKTQLSTHVFYQQAGDLFKVFVGPFFDEASARKTLEELRKRNYPDAWLVY